MSKMFSFITKTWNPLGGTCPHNCVYCWAKALIKRNKFKKYEGKPRIIDKELKKRFTADDFVFVQDMSDLFADCVPTRLILRILDYIRDSPAKFLLLTKNPARYIRFIKDKELPKNVVLGITIETGHYHFSKIYPEYGWTHYSDYSKAPQSADRLLILKEIRPLTKLPLFISIEPILNFNDEVIGGMIRPFYMMIKDVKPWGIAVGYDNYNHKLPEPTLEKTLKLIEELEKFTTVHKKTLRKAWYEE